MSSSIAVFSEVIDRVVLILFDNEIRHFVVGEEYRFFDWINETGNLIYKAV